MCGAISKSTINFDEYEFNAPTEHALNLEFQASQIWIYLILFLVGVGSRPYRCSNSGSIRGSILASTSSCISVPPHTPFNSVATIKKIYFFRPENPFLGFCQNGISYVLRFKKGNIPAERPGDLKICIFREMPPT